MRYLCRIAFVSLLLVTLVGCAENQVTNSPRSPAVQALDETRLAAGIATQAGWAIDESEAATLSNQPSGPPVEGIRCLGRQVLADDIVHYAFDVRTGPGEYDVIGLHRVVRESVPYHPIRTRKSVFLQHGDLKDFTGMFLPGLASPRQPDDVGLAVQLAASDLDVWGIDQAWTRVPEGLGDYTFLLDHGLDRCITDLGTGIELARVVRRLTGNGYRKMVLLGYSSGAALGFAYLNEEAVLPPGRQKTCGYIPVDYGLKGDDPNWIEAMRGDVPFYESLIASGACRMGNPFAFFGPPAFADPEGPSELIPGMTNAQAAIALGAYSAYPAIPSVTYHFLAGIFDESGMPAGLQYTPFDDWVDFMLAAPPNETVAFMRDYSMAALPEYDTPWDDHLAAITTPVLYLDAAGGAGGYGLLTLDLISSTDVTVLTFSYHPPEEVLLDFAHIDLFLATGASSFVWTPVRDWIVSHTP